MEFEDIFYQNSDFRIKKKLVGSGTYGSVYEAEKEDDEKIYAAKILKGEKGFDGNMQMMFLREALILGNLHHPSILKLQGINFQSNEDENKIAPTIMTEFLPHGSLKKILLKNESINQI